MKKKGKYNTHPLVGAALALSLMVTAAMSAASYAEWKYIEKVEQNVRARYDMCALEAYVSMCEAIKNGDAESAADALSRCELYCGEGEFASLRARILSNSIVGADIMSVDDIMRAQGSGEDIDVTALIADELRRADKIGRHGHDGAVSGGGMSTSVPSTSSAGWETLKNKLDVSHDDALDAARDAIGGGALLHVSEKRTLPLVYAFTCKNGMAEVTRAGGHLLRMHIFRHGSANVRGADACRQAAADFVEDVELGDCAQVGENYDGGVYRYEFCGTFYFGGHRVLVPDEAVTVDVDENGASVCGFDASGYYMHRRVSYELPKELPPLPEGGNVRGGLIYSDGKLFWSESGVTVHDLT